MPTLRQYLDLATVNQITGANITDEKMLNVAEGLVDSYCLQILNWNRLDTQKSTTFGCEFSSSQIVFTNTSLTLVGQSYSTNQFQFTVIELLADSGAIKKGTKIPVLSSNNNVLNFDSVSNLNGASIPVKIYQVGIFPRLQDTGMYGKSIPIQVIEAVAWQASYLSKLGATTDSAVSANQEKAKKKSESIGSSYSYTNSDQTNSSNSLCEQSKNILESLL